VGFHLKFLVMGVARTNHFSLRQRCALATQLSLQSKSNIDQTCIRCNVPDHFLPPLYHILARWKCTLSGSRGLHVNSTVTLPVGSFPGARADRVHTTPCMVCGKTFLPGRLFCSPALTPKLLHAGWVRHVCEFREQVMHRIRSLEFAPSHHQPNVHASSSLLCG
jgi:hypothetical protein